MKTNRIARLSTGLFRFVPYKCRHSWPEGCSVQAGIDGLVIEKPSLKECLSDHLKLEKVIHSAMSKNVLPESYRTAFFEAFPEAGGVIRGEGVSPERAEDEAWTKFVIQRDCEPHEFERRGYKNGYCFCKKCGLQGTFLEPTTACKSCGKKSYYHILETGDVCCESCLGNCVDTEPCVICRLKNEPRVIRFSRGSPLIVHEKCFLNL